MISCDLCHGQGKPNTFLWVCETRVCYRATIISDPGIQKNSLSSKRGQTKKQGSLRTEKAVLCREEAWWSNWFASVGRGPGSRGTGISQKGFLFFQEDLKFANINGTLKNTERETKSMRLRRWIWWNPQRPFGTLLAQIWCRIWEGGSGTSRVS